MREKGVTEAWVGSFNGLLHGDVGAVNARLAADCKNFEVRSPVADERRADAHTSPCFQLGIPSYEL